MSPTEKAPRNRTITLTESEEEYYRTRLRQIDKPCTLDQIVNSTICQSFFQVVDFLPDQSVDVLFADPPYNLNKSFNEQSFSQMSLDEYEEWLDSWISRVYRLLKPSASIYVCGEWRSSTAIHRVLERYFIVRNRITWEREKGRGAKANWKNCSEDIWFCTMSNTYVFNVNHVKLKRKVLAPYTDNEGKPKDWAESDSGRFRDTFPSNLWTDLTVPFWSMPENTDHPTQKPEKLLAKVLLASSKEGDVILDPFLGSGTTSVVAKKLRRKFIGIEMDKYYCCIAEKRLDMADMDSGIQGYSGGYFWERNSLVESKKEINLRRDSQPTLL